MLTIRIPTALRVYADGEVRVVAGTVGEALDVLVERHPPLRTHLFDERGELRPYVLAFLNDADVRSLGGAATPVRSGDTITIVPSIAGG